MTPPSVDRNLGRPVFGQTNIGGTSCSYDHEYRQALSLTQNEHHDVM